MKKLLVLFIFMIAFSGCEYKKGNRKAIYIKGSDTMVNLVLKWAERYDQTAKNHSIQVTGGGSGTGVAALINGTVNIATISRELKSRELKAAQSRGVFPVKTAVALDGIAIIVNKDNPVDSLTYEQLREIYTGEISNWKDVGGNDLKILLYGRENSSGTYEFFRKSVLYDSLSGSSYEFHASTRVLQGTAALGEAVSYNVNGIGYGGVGYFYNHDDLKILKLKNGENSPAISPVLNNKLNEEAIRSGEYLLARKLYCFTNGEPKGLVKSFIDYTLSDAGQKIVKEMRYISLN